jgi:hypothetical protein
MKVTSVTVSPVITIELTNEEAVTLQGILFGIEWNQGNKYHVMAEELSLMLSTEHHIRVSDVTYEFPEGDFLYIKED